MRRADSRPPGLHGAPNGYYSQQRLLAKELRISVITTKRAYEELEREGFLENVPGKGCFVAPQNRELLREAQLRRVEDILAQAVDEARKGGIPLEELQELLNLLYQGDES